MNTQIFPEARFNKFSIAYAAMNGFVQRYRADFRFSIAYAAMNLTNWRDLSFYEFSIAYAAMNERTD